MKKILLADDFPLPLAVITEPIAIMGRKGSGKTYTRGRLRTLRLIEYPSPGTVRACDILFLD